MLPSKQMINLDTVAKIDMALSRVLVYFTGDIETPLILDVEDSKYITEHVTASYNGSNNATPR